MIFNYDLLSFQIMSVEHVAHRNGSFSVKARPFAALSFRLGGRGEFEIDGKRLVAREGDVVFIPAGKPYKVEYSFSDFIVVHLPACNYTEAEVIEVGDRKAIEALFVRLHDNWKLNHRVNPAKSCVYDILHRLSISSSGPHSYHGSEAEKCLRYLEEHFCDGDMSVETLCRRTYISRSSLQRYFKHNFDTSPKQYILMLRMKRAMELLSQSDRTIAEIAADCGFGDAKYFSRIFKQTYGSSPSRFRSWILI